MCNKKRVDLDRSSDEKNSCDCWTFVSSKREMCNEESGEGRGNHSSGLTELEMGTEILIVRGTFGH
jgi:hypothetical protein